MKSLTTVVVLASALFVGACKDKSNVPAGPHPVNGSTPQIETPAETNNTHKN